MDLEALIKDTKHKVINGIYADKSVLLRACEFGSEELFDLIINQKNIKPEFDFNLPFFYAYHCSHFNICKKLLKYDSVIKLLEKQDYEIFKKMQDYLKISNF